MCVPWSLNVLFATLRGFTVRCNAGPDTPLPAKELEEHLRHFKDVLDGFKHTAEEDALHLEGRLHTVNVLPM